MHDPTQQDAWRALEAHHQQIAPQHMREWFQKDTTRFTRYSLQVNDILLDYSRNRITDETLTLLRQLAHAMQLPTHIQQLFAGHPVNVIEKRPALHTALRHPHPTLIINGENIGALIHQTLAQMATLTEQIHTGAWRGITNQAIKTIVVLGVGGSALGAIMCCDALKDFTKTSLHYHFITSIDPIALNDVIETIDPETTLFIVASKTFTTLETITNFHFFRTWMQQKLSPHVMEKHFIAITANLSAALAENFPKAHILPIWDWVGGRYSIWSAMGLPLMLCIGEKAFREFLSGAFEIDQHFQQADFAHNIPVMLALLSVWYINFFNTKVEAIAPYIYRLRHLVPYLQQMSMESNGKNTNLTGETIAYSTGSVLFGGEGCHGQHTYHQLLHQGQHLIPVDFILAGHATRTHHHDMLIASGLSQALALMMGNYANHQEAHQVNLGNRPSNIIFLKTFTPKTLGSLLAIYEHKIFVQGVLWRINVFDQWGVELGKQLLPAILQSIQTEQYHAHLDTATIGCITHFKRLSEA